jgi:hypothetical protein
MAVAGTQPKAPPAALDPPGTPQDRDGFQEAETARRILRAGKEYGYDKAAVAETCKGLHGKLPSKCDPYEIEDLLVAMRDNPKGDVDG